MRALALVLAIVVVVAAWLALRSESACATDEPTAALPVVEDRAEVTRASDLDSAQLAFTRSDAVDVQPSATLPAPTPRDLRSTLRVRVRRTDGSIAPRAELRVLTAARRLLADARADDDGVASIAVPSGVPLLVAAREAAPASAATPGAELARAAVALDVDPLAADEERELVLDLVGYALLDVRVVDQRGAPVVLQPLGVARTLGTADVGEATTLISANAMPELRHPATTDAHGRCVVGPVRAGAGWLVLAPLRKPWERESADAVAPIAQRFVVPDSGGRLELRVVAARALYVRGRVEVEDGELFPPGADPDASPNVILIASRATGDGITGQPERDGTFAIGPLVDDEYELTSFGRYAPMDPVRVRPGGPPFVIRVVRGGRIAGRAIDATTRNGVASEFALTKQGIASLATYGSGGEDGSIGADGLAPGEYALAAWTSDGRVGVASHVRVDAKGVVDGVEVVLRPRAECGELRVVVREASDVQAWDATGCRVVAYVKPGAPRSLAVPAGAIEVRRVSNASVLERRSFTVAAGEIADVVFDR